ncbi:NTP transferase domain-containing protein [Roseomonas elaeocarpi]|uniref:NTP transferase domain-containing protein n=1 Tax=Roseomonas elaeocarpi TaxID=907779 RepID=A0ABV6JQY9_9PROT
MTVTALVLAGSRLGEDDPVARFRGVANKALAPVAGVPMLERVVTCLARTPRIGGIVVSGADQAAVTALPALAELVQAGRLTVMASTPSPAMSTAAAFDAFGSPLLVTTADHALLTVAMVEHMLDATPDWADASAGLASSEVIKAAFPQSKRTYLRFADGAWSGCNLFFLRSNASRSVVVYWQRLEAERKHPLRMLRLISPWLLIKQRLGLLTLRAALDGIGRRTAARLAVVEMPMAEAAVDVDKVDDLHLAEELITLRH